MYQEVTFGTKKKWSFKTGDLLKGLFHMKFCMTGQEKGKAILTKDVLRGHLWDT